MNKVFFCIFLFSLMLLVDLNSDGAKVKILPFIELKDGKFVHKKEELSIGVSYSVGGLLKILPGYDVDYEYSEINYELGNLESAIKNNPGYEMYMWVVYKKKDDIVRYDVRVYDNDKKELFSFVVDGDYNNPDDIFNVVDNIVMGVAKRLLRISSDIGFGVFRFNFEGLGGKTYKVFLNRKEVFTVSNDTVSSIRIFSGVDYEVMIYRVDDEKLNNVYKGVLRVDRDGSRDITYRTSGDVYIAELSGGHLVTLDGILVNLPYKSKVLGNAYHKVEIYKGEKLESTKEFYVKDGETIEIYCGEKVLEFRLGSGTSGMINFSAEFFPIRNTSVGARLGLSILGISSFVLPVQLISRFYFYKIGGNIDFYGFGGLGGNVFFNNRGVMFPELINAYGGIGIGVWNFFLDLGGAIGLNVINASSFYFGPYFTIGLRF